MTAGRVAEFVDVFAASPGSFCWNKRLLTRE